MLILGLWSMDDISCDLMDFWKLKLSFSLIYCGFPFHFLIIVGYFLFLWDSFAIGKFCNFIETGIFIWLETISTLLHRCLVWAVEWSPNLVQSCLMICLLFCYIALWDSFAIGIFYNFIKIWIYVWMETFCTLHDRCLDWEIEWPPNLVLSCLKIWLLLFYMTKEPDLVF